MAMKVILFTIVEKAVTFYTDSVTSTMCRALDRDTAFLREVPNTVRCWHECKNEVFAVGHWTLSSRTESTDLASLAAKPERPEASLAMFSLAGFVGALSGAVVGIVWMSSVGLHTAGLTFTGRGHGALFVFPFLGRVRLAQNFPSRPRRRCSSSAQASFVAYFAADKAFKNRFRHIMDCSQGTLKEDALDVTVRLDMSERELFSLGREALDDLQRWMRRDSHKIATASMVTNHRKRKRAALTESS
ncbi:hypothetical protein HPB51_018673 [Rhipicephalus microplus]|uniref:Uncharacterized protein n=2 Tax=Rhipicephalus microplus TaxID=6941 RepID=A0A9J6DBR7_RHIMP|nr:hypothetical protein HPB51_018673 [Rhipicephalus microplus]